MSVLIEVGVSPRGVGCNTKMDLAAGNTNLLSVAYPFLAKQHIPSGFEKMYELLFGVRLCPYVHYPHGRSSAIAVGRSGLLPPRLKITKGSILSRRGIEKVSRRHLRRL